MKHVFIVGVIGLCIFSANTGHAQPDTAKTRVPVGDAATARATNSPLYIIASGADRYEIAQNTTGEIKPEWIADVYVFKGEDAVRRYGKRGEDGVVLITLDKGTVLPDGLKKKMTPIN